MFNSTLCRPVKVDQAAGQQNGLPVLASPEHLSETCCTVGIVQLNSWIVYIPTGS